MQIDVITGRDTGDETPEPRTDQHDPYQTLVERLYAQMVARQRGVLAAQQGGLFGDGDGGVQPQPLPAKPGFPSIGKMIDEAKKQAQAPHPLSSVVGPIIKGVINHKKAQPTCTVPPGSSPPLTPPPTKSEPAADGTAPAADATSSAGKGSKGPQATPAAVAAARKKKAKLKAGIRP